ncbi:MAG: hypothetical protein IOD12_05785 [Silvanigrellales bacterium]|nr:hypothetical protein [Silvanigrellales bacterium]
MCLQRLPFRILRPFLARLAAVTVTSLCAGALPLYAQSPEPPSDVSLETLSTPHFGRRVSRIEVFGNAKTRTSFLLRRLLLSEGELLRPGEVERSVQNLKNTKLFKTIRVEFVPVGDAEVVVRLFVDELWTTIPVLLFSTGGGSVLILAGMVEANLFGHGAVGYLTYQYLDGANSLTGQMKHPDVFDTGFEVMPYFWLEEKNNEVRTYNKETKLLGGFTSHQQTYGATLRKTLSLNTQILPVVTPGIGGRYSEWRFTDEQLSSEAKEANRKNDFPTPTQNARAYGSAELQLGRVDFNGNLADGATFLYRYTLGASVSKNSGPFEEQFITARYYRTLPYDVLLAARYEWQRRTSANAGDEDMLGGLFHVRGLPNDIFRGQTLWMLNVETRRIVRRQQYVHWQLVAFTDVGDTGRTRTQTSVDYRPNGAAHSVGGGVRALFPDISELAVRLDYGWLVAPFRASGLSLGLVQFIR